MFKTIKLSCFLKSHILNKAQWGKNSIKKKSQFIKKKKTGYEKVTLFSSQDAEISVLSLPNFSFKQLFSFT